MLGKTIYSFPSKAGSKPPSRHADEQSKAPAIQVVGFDHDSDGIRHTTRSSLEAYMP